MEPSSRLSPVKEFRVYRRNLPHFELPGSAYFVTFNTVEGFTLSDPAKDIIFSAFKFHADKKYKLLACVVMDTHVHCILQPLTIQRSQARTPVPPGTPVPPEMPVTPKMTVQPDTFYSLSQITHGIKSFSAHRIRALVNRKIRVWQDESYDRIIRDEKE